MGALVARSLARRSLSPEEQNLLDESVGLMVLTGGLGARLAFLASHPALWSTPSQWWKFWEGGMVSYGGLIGSLLALNLALGRRRIDAAGFFDRISPAILTGWSVGRMGCFLTWEGEEGTPTTLPWAILVDGNPHHPVQLYLVGLLCISAVSVARVPVPRPGDRAALSVLLYSCVRAFTDVFRHYEPLYLRTLSQVVCLTLFGGALLWLLRGRPGTAKKIPSRRCGTSSK